MTVATFDDFKHWLRRHGYDPTQLARTNGSPTLHIGASDNRTYLLFDRYVDGPKGRQIDRTTGEPLVESVMVPFDLVAGEAEE